MSTDETLDALRAELDRARAKFPTNAHLYAALGEEVGELARELLENGTRERIREEAIQVACVAIRIADEGDRDFPLSIPKKGPAAKPEPEKPVVRYASGEEPMIGDTVEYTLSDAQQYWWVERLDCNVARVRDRWNEKDWFCTRNLRLVRRAEAAK